MSFVIINKGLNEPILEGYHFTHKELHPNSNSNLTDQVGLPDKLKIAVNTLHVLEAIRRYYGVPIHINASARTKQYQSTLSGGAANSEHVIDSSGWFSALDIDFENNSEDYRNDFRKHIINRTPFFESLLELGLNGIGLYDTFFHIDAGERREEKTKGFSLNGKKYSKWDYRHSKPELSFLDSASGTISNYANLISGINNEGSDEITTDLQGVVKKSLSILS